MNRRRAPLPAVAKWQLTCLALTVVFLSLAVANAVAVTMRWYCR